MSAFTFASPSLRHVAQLSCQLLAAGALLWELPSRQRLGHASPSLPALAQVKSLHVLHESLWSARDALMNSPPADYCSFGETAAGVGRPGHAFINAHDTDPSRTRRELISARCCQTRQDVPLPCGAGLILSYWRGICMKGPLPNSFHLFAATSQEQVCGIELLNSRILQLMP